MIKSLYHYLLIIRSGYFDRSYYLEKYPDVRNAYIDPVWHFVRNGWQEHRNPSKGFNTAYYLNNYQDVKNLGINPLIHYIKFGHEENRVINDNANESVYKYELNNLHQVNDGYIFISHNASLTGAPLNFLHICEAYKEHFGNNFVIIAITGGPLLKEFQDLGRTINLSRNIYGVTNDRNLQNLFSNLFDLGYKSCIANTIVSASFVKILNDIGFNSLFAIHELPEAIELLGAQDIAKELARSNNNIVFAAEFVAKKFQQEYCLAEEKIFIAPQGIRDSLIYKGKILDARRKLLRKIGVENPENVKIILSAGLAQKAKGTDLFIEVAKILYQINKLNNIHFIWLGNRDEEFEIVKNQLGNNQPFATNIHFLDFELDPAYIFAAADLYLLTSRADAFPSAALEALANQTPVIMFKDTSGIEEILDGNNGIAVSTLDTHEMASEILKRLKMKDTKISTKIPSYKSYIKKLISIIEISRNQFQNSHKVSVIIPNYNYENFLNERINSIINQSYQPSEIIFLDDASTDQSVLEAKNLLSETSIPHRIITNSENKGVFRQWIKGIKESQYEYIWIAEADDIASIDFLSVVMQGFKDKDVVISYCQSKIIDEKSNVHTHDYYQNYIGDLSETKWQQSYIENGIFEVTNYLAIRNTIPNASAVVIRKNALLNIENELIKFLYAGDWFAYVNALKKGKIYYSHQKLNSFRRHHKSQISSGGGNQVFLDEIKTIYTVVTEDFLLNKSILSKMEENYSTEAGYSGEEKPENEFFSKLRKTTINQIMSLQHLNILIVLSEFNIGGGEITGLRLANQLSKNHNVYLYNAKKINNSNFIKMIDKNVNVILHEDELLNLIHSGKLNFVNSHIWWGDKFIYHFLKNNSIYWILSMHGCYEMLLKNFDVDPEFYQLSKEMIKRADFITYDAEKNLEALKLLSEETIYSKTQKIYHGFAPKEQKEEISKTDLGIDKNSFIFIFVARGIKEKGWQEIIDASILLKKNQFNIDVIFIGDSNFVELLRKKYRSLNFLHFLGEQHNLQGFLSISNCALLPTYFVSESQPLTIIEYLAAGVPIISSDIGEIRSMISLDNLVAGITLPIIDGEIKVNHLYKAMRKIMEDQDLYSKLQNSTTKIFERKFGIEKFAKAYLSIYYQQL